MKSLIIIRLRASPCLNLLVWKEKQIKLILLNHRENKSVKQNLGNWIILLDPRFYNLTFFSFLKCYWSAPLESQKVNPPPGQISVYVSDLICPESVDKTYYLLQYISKIEFWWSQIFENLIIHNSSAGSREIPQKIWARSVQPFWRLLDTNKQTNKQTDRQAKIIYR